MDRKPAKDLKNEVSSGDRYVIVLAGPNGAGKSTFYDMYLAPLGIPFVNADLIAQERGLNGYDGAKAADKMRRELLEEDASFCMETVFSDPAGDKINLLKYAQERGYLVILIYIGLENPELCIARVIQRVDDGGHDVPDDKIKARFSRSLENLAAAAAFVDILYIFDNSSTHGESYRCFAKFERGRLAWQTEYIPAWASQVYSFDT